MTPYRSKGAQTFKMRVTLPDGRSGAFSCGTRDAKVARDVARMVQHFRDRRDWAPLEAVYSKVATLAALYDAHCTGRVPELVARAAIDAKDVDLAPLVEIWGGRGRKSVSPKYVVQVRRLIPEGKAFRLSAFTRGAISKHLEELDVSDPTRNRHKAAISQFARWLVARGILNANPVRDATTFSERAPRMVYLSPENAKRLVDALDGGARVAVALAIGAGLEWQAIAAATSRDLDLAAGTIHAHGAKNRHRDRVVPVTEPWCLAIVGAYARRLLPDTPLVQLTIDQVRAQQRAALKRLKLPPMTLHDHRHTYAVTALKRGDAPQLVKRQLGHAPNSALLWTTYGAYMPEIVPKSATNPATTKRKEVK